MRPTKAERLARQAQRTVPKPVEKPAPTQAPTPRALAPVPIVEWTGAYDEGWRGFITAESFAHPAKAARGLLTKIFDHLFAIGVLSKGSLIVDPFGGIGTTAIAGAWRGCRVICAELEPKFVALANENVALHTRGLTEMQLPIPVIVQGDSRQLRQHVREAVDAAVSSPPYAAPPGHDTGHPRLDATEDARREMEGSARRSGYGNADGNIAHAPEGSVDAVVSSPQRPDDRATVDAVVSSPPYDKDGLGHYRGEHNDQKESKTKGLPNTRYGEAEGQLGSMESGGVDAIISSPPYAEIATGAGGLNTQPPQHDGQQGGRSAESASQDTDQRYGDAAGQLAKMEKGEVDVVISSPPYEPGQSKEHPSLGSVNKDNWGNEGTDIAGRRGVSANYGETDGQLGAMESGGVDAIISSPPYAESLDPDRGGARHKEGFHQGETQGKQLNVEGYGRSDGQLEQLRTGGVDAIISSPPFGSGDSASAQSIVNRTDKSAMWIKENVGPSATKGYGETEGQMAEMEMKQGVDAVVTSPPYEGSLQSNIDQKDAQKGTTKRAETGGAIVWGSNADGSRSATGYSDRSENLGNCEGDTFWSAARDIVRECHAILKPGGYAVWIVKAFVRDKAIVDFPGDWRKLCEYVGFETLTEVHAMLVKDKSFTSVFGENIEAKKERKSFFRRLAESKGSPRIDHEVVYIMKKRDS